MKIQSLACSLLLGASLLTACKHKEDDPTPANTANALTTYANMALAVYEDAYTTATSLRGAVDVFASNPTQANLEACRAAWKAARIPYGQSEGFRFYGGPIDNDTDGPEGYINGWPVDESYIDYVQGIEDTISIIARPDRFGPITEDLIIDRNERDAETEITTGYHAIEFLLWGQDLSATGPGNRPVTDYTTDAHANRRMEYLKVVTGLLVKHLDQVRNGWQLGADYRTHFLNSANSTESLRNAFRGIGALAKGELANERMRVAMQNGDQEDEHSCFSDNTNVDIEGNFHSIRNIYKGSYTRVDGTVVSGYSLSDLVRSKNSGYDEHLLEVFATTQANIDAIFTGSLPFDQAILTRKTEIDKAVRSLEDVGDDVVNAASGLGISVNIVP